MSLLWPESHSVFAQGTSSEGWRDTISVGITASFIPQPHQRTLINLLWGITQKITVGVSFGFNITRLLCFAYTVYLVFHMITRINNDYYTKQN